MKTLKSCILAAGFAASATAAFAAGQVTIATDATFPPFESVDSNGKLVGYDVELMDAICKAAKLDCNIIGAAWEGMFPGLLSRKYDALISQLTVTEARRKQFAFSEIYEHPVFRFVGKAGSHFDFTPEGLAGKVIAVQTGTPMDKFVTAHFPKATIKRYDGGSAPYLDLAAGRADLHMSYEAQIRSSFLGADSGKGYELIGPSYTGKDAPEFGEGVAIAVNKNNPELLKAINEGLAKVRADGKLEQLDAKYLGSGKP